MKFGDIVINHWAGTDNPQRIGIFIRRNSVFGDKCFEFTDGAGCFWSQAIKDNMIEIVGHLDLTPFLDKKLEGKTP